MNRTAIPIIALALLVLIGMAVPATAVAGDDEGSGNDWAKAAGWQLDYAPTSTHISAYTEFVGSKNQFTEADLDTWKGIFVVSAEVAIPGVPISIFGDIGYQAIASGDTSTGWKDPNVGVKVNFELFDFMLIGVNVKGNIPVGTNAVTLEAYEATSVGVSGTIMVANLLFGNAGFDFGRLWKIAEEDGSSSQGFQYAFFAEGGINTGFLGVSGRVGLRGVLRDTGFDKDQFELYAEGTVLMFFLRVSLPFDLQGGALEGVKTAFETGTLKVVFGVNFGF